MTTTSDGRVIGCDVSEWQVPLDGSYPHSWIILRSSLSTYKVDNKIGQNLPTARAMRDAGQLTSIWVYHVWYPGSNQAQINNILRSCGGPIGDVTLMIDVESWGGDISGDHSGELNEFAEMCRAIAANVVRYGNQGDLARIWPDPVGWIDTIVAAYQSREPSIPHVGWQYSNGQDSNGVPNGWPRASAPFGRCDHDVVIPDLTPAAGGQPIQEDDMFEEGDRNTLVDTHNWVRSVVRQVYAIIDEDGAVFAKGENGYRWVDWETHVWYSATGRYAIGSPEPVPNRGRDLEFRIFGGPNDPVPSSVVPDAKAVAAALAGDLIPAITDVVKNLPTGATPQQIAKAVNDDLAKRVES